MRVLKKPFGGYQTNCYVLLFDGFEFIIDPGYGSTDWLRSVCSNPLAILITHGHHDHVWDVRKVKSLYKSAVIYCPTQDSFMLETDCFNLHLSTCSVDVKVCNDKNMNTIDICGVPVAYWHFPGHTPGCSVIEVGGRLFSGDFVFRGSIGRSDLPFSNGSDMRDSLVRFRRMRKDSDTVIHPGHGEDSFLGYEQEAVPYWIATFDN